MRFSNYDAKYSIEIVQQKQPKDWVSALPFSDIQKRCICPTL